MYKVNFTESVFPFHQFFKIFKTETEANAFIKELGNKFISVKFI
jgi:hypothetical protein